MSYVIANQRGQIAALQAKLDSAGGRGGELPSCWAEQGGKIDYVYDVILTSNGIRMRQYQYGERIREKMLITSWLPNAAETLTEATFMEHTKPWYDYSRATTAGFLWL